MLVPVFSGDIPPSGQCPPSSVCLVLRGKLYPAARAESAEVH